MFNLRQANLQDLEALIQLRLELLREAGDIKGNSDTEWSASLILKGYKSS
ncbi:hypothetical protein LC612_17235 [Nostoc sp. CHAB 5834]|nr:hypothetical protein [Nostoc sp. CHAB 5834]